MAEIKENKVIVEETLSKNLPFGTRIVKVKVKGELKSIFKLPKPIRTTGGYKKSYHKKRSYGRKRTFRKRYGGYRRKAVRKTYKRSYRRRY